jgi:hypothetical protein
MLCAFIFPFDLKKTWYFADPREIFSKIGHRTHWHVDC